MRKADAALERAVDAVQRAQARGADQAEAEVTTARRFSAEARGERITSLERSDTSTLTLRVMCNGRRATLSTTEVDPAQLDAIVERAVRVAEYVDIDPLLGLPDAFAQDNGEALQLFDRAVDERADDDRLSDALEMERALRQADRRIVDGGSSYYGDATIGVALANSVGFARAYTATRASRSASPLALDGQTKRTAHFGTAARYLDALDTCTSVAKMAARRATELFGARKAPTGTMSVIFERDVAAAVLGDLFSACSAANVAIGNSWLADKIGECIGSPLVQITDNGRIPRALGSSPFDAQGVATQETVVLENGIMRSFLSNTYYGRKLGIASTGNASGGGVGPTTFALAIGTSTLDDLIASTKRGILVLDIIGFAHEYASGSYSRGARGLYIENGEIAYPVEEFTIASEMGHMLMGIDAVADDLIYDASIVSPSFRIHEMSIGGA
ncbi:MAG: TldD/PmbA family protein [Vulcanimicrobiaceae bacterium]